jgi:hypothetical protein
MSNEQVEVIPDKEEFSLASIDIPQSNFFALISTTALPHYLEKN